MRYILLPEGEVPTPEHCLDPVAGRDGVVAKLDGHSVLYSLDDDADDDDDEGCSTLRICTVRAVGEAGYEVVRQAVLSDSRWLYLNGDCWTLAIVAARRLDLPIAIVECVENGKMAAAHAALALPDGHFIDIRGVLDEKGLFSNLGGGGHRTVLVDEPGLFARLKREYGYEIDLETTYTQGSFFTDTQVLFDLFLVDLAHNRLEIPLIPR